MIFPGRTGALTPAKNNVNAVVLQQYRRALYLQHSRDILGLGCRQNCLYPAALKEHLSGNLAPTFLLITASGRPALTESPACLPGSDTTMREGHVVHFACRRRRRRRSENERKKDCETVALF